MQQRDHLELTRVKAFSDGVIAIAATLLVTNIHLTNESDQSLGALLDQLAPQIGAFLISFAVCAVYWRNHNRLFNLLHRVDQRLNMLNMAQLASVCLMPFVSGLIAGEVPGAGAMALYALAIGLVGLLSASLWAYVALKPGLIGPDVDRAELWAWCRIASIPPTVFLLSIAIAHYSVPWAMRSWALTALLLPLARKLERR